MIVSSLSSHNQHLLFCCVLPIFASTGLVLLVLFYVVVRRDFAFLWRRLILSHVQDFSWEILLICCLKYLWNCFSSHFCFLGIVVLLILVLCLFFSGRCKQSFFTFFQVVFELLYRCIDAIFSAGECSSSFFFDAFNQSMSSLRCKFVCIIVSFVVLGPLFKFFPLPLQEWSRLAYERDSPSFYPLNEISYI